MLSKAAVILACPAAVTAHFGMNKPAPWVDPDGTFGMGINWRRAGCKPFPAPGQKEWDRGCAAEWYTNNTHIPGEKTLPDEMRTYKDFVIRLPGTHYNITFPSHKNPWFAPGSAPLASPCGFDGGNPEGCPAGNPGGGGCKPGGYGHGTDARTLKGNTKPTVWKAGSIVEAAWGNEANHGGGYQYRLCPLDKSKSRVEALTEECFQKMPLKFHGDTQWAQWREDVLSRVAFKANRTTVGTTPAGSQWTKNPIPACAGPAGGSSTTVTKAWTRCYPWIGEGKSPYQFPPPAPGVFGFWGYGPIQTHGMQFSIVDKLEVPADLPAGDYVLSFRIDCEQTPQVWNTCADIRITASDADVLV